MCALLSTERDGNVIYVEELDISRAGSLMLGQNGFRSFEALKRLIATNASLNRIDERWFSGTSNLDYLDFSHNDVESLRRDNFRNIRKLIQLYLVDNAIGTMERNVFVDLQRLEVLSICNNRLTTLTEIGSLPRLRIINYSENSIGEVRTIPNQVSIDRYKPTNCVHLSSGTQQHIPPTAGSAGNIAGPKLHPTNSRASIRQPGSATHSECIRQQCGPAVGQHVQPAPIASARPGAERHHAHSFKYLRQFTES